MKAVSSPMKGAKNRSHADDESEIDLQKEAVIESLTDLFMFGQRSYVRDLSQELNNCNISFAHFFLLGFLVKEDTLTITEISRNIGHSTAAATGLVDRLEKIGYVQRIHAADDRRKVAVQITRKGIELLGRLRNLIGKNLREVAEVNQLNIGASLLTPSTAFGRNFGRGGDESYLIEAINRGFPQEFWEKFRELKEKGENADLTGDEVREMTEMADRIEETDAERMAAVAELAQLRGEPFETVLAEFEIEAAIH